MWSAPEVFTFRRLAPATGLLLAPALLPAGAQAALSTASAPPASAPPASAPPASAPAAAPDGRLDEPQWASAATLSSLVQVRPASFAPDALGTEVRWWTDARGLHVGFRNRQRGAEQSVQRHARDQASPEADQNSLLIDFAGDGRNAYLFTVSNGGSRYDATLDREGLRNTDWDGNWQVATARDDDGWTSEWFLPWQVAAMPEPDANGRLRVGLYAHRYHHQRGEHVASAPFFWLGTDVLARLPALELTRPQAVTRLDVSPYLSLSHERVRGDNQQRAGVDLFWQPDSAQLISATLNPDFGQVESDELVVNFTATETLVSEKRPFFAENQNLFTLNANRGLRLVHTRRIGGAPDAGNEGQSDLRAAGKYTYQSEAFDGGLFHAQEDDSAQAQGRRYSLARAVGKGSGWQMGWLGSQVQRPTLQRDAQINALDVNLQVADNARLEALWLQSDIEQAHSTASGNGWNLRGFWQIDDAWRTRWSLLDYDPGLDVRDFGYSSRVNTRQFFLDTTYTDADFADDALTQSRNWRFWLHAETLADGTRMPGAATVTMENLFRSTAFLSAELEYWSSGIDDWSSRFQQAFWRDEGWFTWINGRTAPFGNWRLEAEWNRYKSQSVHGYLQQFILRPNWRLSEQLQLKFELQHLRGNDWLIWRSSELRSYQRRHWQLGLELQAQLHSDHELRLKWQWYALHADGRNRYTTIDRQLLPVAALDERFSDVRLALQVRYLWHFNRNADLYLVYSRGGLRDPDRSADDQDWHDDWRDSFSEVSNETLLVKWRQTF